MTFDVDRTPQFASGEAFLRFVHPQWLKGVTTIVVHATGIPDRRTRNRQVTQGISDTQWRENLVHDYRDLQHWSAAPHLFITDRGILTLTPLWERGIGSPDWNTDAYRHVEMCGNFTAEQFDGTPVKALAVSAIAVLFYAGNIQCNDNSLKLHCEDKRDPLHHMIGTTHLECPGSNVKKSDLLQSIRAEIFRLSGIPKP